MGVLGMASPQRVVRHLQDQVKKALKARFSDDTATVARVLAAALQAQRNPTQGVQQLVRVGFMQRGNSKLEWTSYAHNLDFDQTKAVVRFDVRTHEISLQIQQGYTNAKRHTLYTIPKNGKLQKSHYVRLNDVASRWASIFEIATGERARRDEENRREAMNRRARERAAARPMTRRGIDPSLPRMGNFRRLQSPTRLQFP